MNKKRRKPQREFLEHLGERVRTARKSCDLTQVQLAKKAKVTYRHLQEIEYGKVDVRVLTLLRLRIIFSQHGLNFFSVLGE